MYLEKKFTSKNPIPPPLPKLTWLYDMRRSSISNAAAVESRFFKYTPPPTKIVFNPSSGLLASLFVKVEEINKNLLWLVLKFTAKRPPPPSALSTFTNETGLVMLLPTTRVPDISKLPGPVTNNAPPEPLSQTLFLKVLFSTFNIISLPCTAPPLSFALLASNSVR